MLQRIFKKKACEKLNVTYYKALCCVRSTNRKRKEVRKFGSSARIMFFLFPFSHFSTLLFRAADAVAVALDDAFVAAIFVFVFHSFSYLLLYSCCCFSQEHHAFVSLFSIILTQKIRSYTFVSW